MARINPVDKTIDRLIEFWKEHSIKFGSNSQSKLIEFETNKDITLPNDFRKLYLRVNGMESCYPNQSDINGFLFYPLMNIIRFDEEFENSDSSKKQILIFADYLQKSWWYGILIDNVSCNYIIGIIPHKDSFKPITNSLVEFIELYIDDSPILYDYD